MWNTSVGSPEPGKTYVVQLRQSNNSGAYPEPLQSFMSAVSAAGCTATAGTDCINNAGTGHYKHYEVKAGVGGGIGEVNIEMNWDQLRDILTQVFSIKEVVK